VYYLNAGVEASEILQSFPSLRMMDIEAVQAYYAAHKQDIDNELAEEE
jgi:uncharacterized protein (DUF433 family)